MPRRSPRAWLRALLTLDAPLTVVSLLMAALLPLALVGLLVDDRLVAGAPAWLKPAKFAASTAVYGLTLAWILGRMHAWPALRTVASRATAAVFVVEVAIIGLQAWRGVPSHFNVGRPVDALLFSIMGAAIGLQTLVALAVTVALFRERFTDRAMGTALRAAMLLSILGASVGGLMTTPSRAQVADALETGYMSVAGSHTVGAPDGGPGLPGIGWSREHGDLRVPHFVGLHAMQVLPLLAYALRRHARAAWLARVFAGSYAGLFGLLLVQALGGEPLLAPGPLTGPLLIAWAALTVLATSLAARTSRVPLQTSRVAEA